MLRTTSLFWKSKLVCQRVPSVSRTVFRHICSFPSKRRTSLAMETEVNKVTEGLAKAFFPKSVFYNPVQEYNRDLTIAVISEFAEIPRPKPPGKSGKKRTRSKDNEGTSFTEKEGDSVEGNETVKSEIDSPNQCSKSDSKNGLKIFEGLAASGLRSVRFGLEIPGISEIIANDFDRLAVSYIEKNIAHNNLGHIMKARQGDAAMAMYEHRELGTQFSVVDLDPYGSASMFLDSAVQAVEHGGLLCITCTDAAVLCGNAPEKCNTNYGAVSLRSKFCHEQGIRILLQCLDSHANRYSRYIEPLLSLSVDFYFRVFVRVFDGQKQAKLSMTKKAMVYECVGCSSYTLQPVGQAIPCKGEGNFKFMAGTGPTVPQNCIHCGHHHRMGGPIWSAPLHDLDFVRRVIARVQANPEAFGTKDRIVGMLNVVMEELPDIPLYYKLDAVCGVLHCMPPKMVAVRSGILNAGYRVSLSHASKNSYKTDAPTQLIWDIMRAWVKEHPINENRLQEGSVAKAILDKPSQFEVDLTEHSEANPKSREAGLVRWQPNPEPYWGPLAKAKRSHNTDASDKRAANQGKRKKKNSDQASSADLKDEAAQD